MRRVLVAAMAAAMLVGSAGAARADHTHVLILPNGSCAILAAEGEKKYVILPECSSPTTRTPTPTTRHASRACR